MNLFFFVITFVLYTCNASASNIASNICVAERTPYLQTPTGYQCQLPNAISVDDFVYSGFVPGNTIFDQFDVKLTVVSVTELPGLNGLSLSAARIDIGINGSVPMHVHPDESELLIMVQGNVSAGFVTSESAYVKNIKPGDVMVFPKGHMHFLVNSGSETAVAFATYSSSSPTFHFLDDLLFGKNSLPTAVIAQTTLLDLEQIEKLKAKFG